MNVKKGDLAIVVGPTGNAGAIGTVVEFYGNVKDLKHNRVLNNMWLIHFPRPIPSMSPNTGEIFLANAVCIRDCFLRKIAGPDVLKTPEPIQQPVTTS